MAIKIEVRDVLLTIARVMYAALESALIAITLGWRADRVVVAAGTGAAEALGWLAHDSELVVYN